MKLSKCFKHAFEMVVHSKLRSWLTILGIVIGVASVIAIMSLGTGLQQQLNSQLNGLGGDIVTITPGASRGAAIFGQRGGEEFGGGAATATSKTPTLTSLDYQALKGLPDVLLIDTEIRGQVNISYMTKTGKVTMTGVDQRVWSQITTSTVATGRMLTSSDQNVIVVGGRLASSYFDQPLGVNMMVSIQGKAFRIVGILDDQSTNIYMPIQTAFQVIPDTVTGQYDSLVVKVRNQDQLNASMDAMTTRLQEVRHVTAKTQDFSIVSNAQLQQTRAQTLQSLNTFLVALAAISLIVGAVGVANTMFTSVLEKTKEIGIMKAIGARNNDILLIFIFNSACIGLVGGIIGIICGIFLSSAMPALLGTLPFSRGVAYVSLSSIILALTVSLVVGVISGLVPAIQASRLRPVDALRY